MALYRTEKPKTYQTSAEILELVAAVERGRLPASEWNREAWLLLAFWYLYLNSLPDAARLLRESIARYYFENGFSPRRFAIFGKTEVPLLLAALAEFIRIYKGTTSFVALANMVLRSFADHRRQLRNYRRAHLYFSSASFQPRREEDAR